MHDKTKESEEFRREEGAGQQRRERNEEAEEENEVEREQGREEAKENEELRRN